MGVKDIATRIVISAKDEASGVFETLRKNAGKVAAAVAAYFGFNAFVDGIRGAAEFQEQMSKVAAITGAGADEMAQLQQAAEDAGASTRYTATEAAQALENLARSGLNATEAVETLPAVLALAQGNSLELGEAAAFITKAVAGMGLEFSEAGRVADVLAKAAASANTDVQGLGQALSYAAPTANSLGLSLEETVAIIGKFADAGIDAGRAGTSLNAIMAQFADPASKFRRELGAAGITTNNFGQALRQLAEAGPRGAGAILAVGQEAGPALRALLGQGIGALDELRDSLLNAEGAAAKASSVMDSNLNGALRALGSAWETLKNAIYEPLLEPLAAQVSELAARFREFVANGDAAKVAAAIKAAFESALEGFNAFAKGVNLKDLGAKFATFASDVGTTFAGLAGTFKVLGSIFAGVFGAIGTVIDVVKSGFHLLAASVSATVHHMLNVLALLSEGLASLSFGGVAEGFQQVADKIFSISASVEKFAVDRFNDATDAAVRVKDSVVDATYAFVDFATHQDAATESSERFAQKTGEVAAQATLTADQLDALGEGYEFVDGKARKVAESSDAAADGLKKTAAASAAAAEDLKKIGEAFERMGVQTKDELASLADQAKADFETIRDSGKASADGLKQAFEAYAKASIEANNGIADASLKAEAAALGYEAVLKKLLDAANPLSEQMQAIAEAMDKTIDTAERATQVTERKAAADVRAAQSALDLARAKGDDVEITKAQINLAEAQLRGSQRIATAKAAEAAAAEKKVQALEKEAEADGNVTEAEKEAIESATKAADAKRDAADASRDKVEADESELQKVRELSKANKEAGEAVKEVARTASGVAVDLEKGLSVPWLTGAAAASSYASEAIEAAKRAAMALSSDRNPYEFLESYARRYIRTMEELEQRQADMSGGAARGVDDLRLRLLELEGSEKEIAAARKARDVAEVERNIELMRLEVRRALLRNNQDEAQRLEAEIRLLYEQLELIEKIHRAEERKNKSKGGGSGSGGGGVSPSLPVGPTININLGVVSANKATLESLGRDLVPVLGDLTRKGFR